MNLEKLLVVADDFGWTDGHNKAVAQAHTAGLLNAASLMTTTPGFEEAVEIVRSNPDLRVGVHLVLNESAPLGPARALPELTGADGRFHDGIRPLFRLWAAGKLRTGAVQDEWRRQIERALDAGIQVRRLDSHKHVHLFPPLLEAAVALARQYKIPYMRLPLEGFTAAAMRRLPGWLGLNWFAVRARKKIVGAGLAFPDRFIGFAHSGRMDQNNLRRALSRIRPDRRSEIMVHPAVRTEQVQELVSRVPALRRYRFEDELQALLDLSADFSP